MKQIDQLIDWSAIEKAIAVHYAPVSDATGHPAYSGLLLFKMLLTGIWNGGLSDESVKDMANSNLHVMRFLGLLLEDDVPDHSVLSRSKTRLTTAGAWDGLLAQVNEQIRAHDKTVRQGCNVDASIKQSPRKPKPRPAYEMVDDREERDDEANAQVAMRIIEVTQPGVDNEARWVRKGGQPVFGYKQHRVVDDNGLVLVIATTAANCHDSKPLLDLLEKAHIQPGTHIHAAKTYSSQNIAML